MKREKNMFSSFEREREHLRSWLKNKKSFPNNNPLSIWSLIRIITLFFFALYFFKFKIALNDFDSKFRKERASFLFPVCL
jgi:hypothetical protein